MIRPTETAAMKTNRLSILAWHVKPRQPVCGIASVNRFKAALRCRKHCCRMAVAVTSVRRLCLEAVGTITVSVRRF